MILYQEPKADSLHQRLHLAQALVPTPNPWTSPELDTAPSSKASLSINRRNAPETTTDAYTAAHLAIGLHNIRI